jgi:multimeric flavodoxin WrbA
MPKILGICGSPRKGATEYALDQALAGVRESGEVETETILLKGKKINFCIHCDKCIREETDRCTLYEDDMTPLYDTFYQADGYIIASPVYDMAITAQLVAFFNRFRASYTILKDNPQYFIRKTGAAMAIGGTRNGGQETAIQVIHNFFHTMGMTVVNGSMSGYAGASLWSRDRKAEGVKEDTFGLQNAVDLGKKAAGMVSLIAERV